MRKSLVFLAFAILASASDPLRVFNHEWSVPFKDDWKIEEQDGATVLHMSQGREPLPGARRPFQFAVAETPAFRSVTVEADIKPLKRSVMIVYAYRDSSHFNYAHLSTDTTTPVHNGVFHVYGGERVRISPEIGPASFPTINRWYHVRLVQDGKTGSVDVMVDGKQIPALHAVDLSLTTGRVGIGSFNETGDFKNVKITGVHLQGEGQ